MARESLEIAGGGIATVAIGAAASQACGTFLDVLALCWTCLGSGVGIHLSMRVQDRWSIPVALFAPHASQRAALAAAGARDLGLEMVARAEDEVGSLNTNCSFAAA